ncbi:MAG: CDP-diacylglycerol--serine O-phosphatidyltransferase [Cyclobacteriaceae bacterium]|nr:CDP-diacylglycerol--serine O-phosphatidyltransferase [Cyclobacteriaceae bacterium]
MIRHLPNFLTCCNLLCGCIGIVFALENRPIPAAYFVWVACVFDFFDGFTARSLKVKSPIGKELDSLADVVSFGVLPAIVVYKLWNADAEDYLPFLSFSIAIFSALRLAIFNIDDTQKDSFRGLPTPANALLLTALPLQDSFVLEWLINPWILTTIIMLSSWLLVSPIELFALKFKNFTWQENKIRFTFLIISVLVLAIWQAPAIPLVIILYIALSLGVQALSK